jgi:hypothetical protein
MFDLHSSMQFPGAPPKPWERAGAEGTSGPAPFKPPSGGSTSDVVEASGTAKPGETIAATNVSANLNSTVSRPMPQRPWQQQSGYGNSYGGNKLFWSVSIFVDDLSKYWQP